MLFVKKKCHNPLTKCKGVESFHIMFWRTIANASRRTKPTQKHRARRFIPAAPSMSSGCVSLISFSVIVKARANNTQTKPPNALTLKKSSTVF